MILLDDLGDGYPTFPQFQRALRVYEAGLRTAALRVGDTVTVRTPAQYRVDPTDPDAEYKRRRDASMTCAGYR